MRRGAEVSYQTLINCVPQDYIAHQREPLESTLRKVIREELRRAGSKRSETQAQSAILDRREILSSPLPHYEGDRSVTGRPRSGCRQPRKGPTIPPAPNPERQRGVPWASPRRRCFCLAHRVVGRGAGSSQGERRPHFSIAARCWGRSGRSPRSCWISVSSSLGKGYGVADG
jgi:hypothetical protein